MYTVYFQNEEYRIKADYFEIYSEIGIYIFYKKIKGQKDFEGAHFPIQGTVILNANPIPEESEK